MKHLLTLWNPSYTEDALTEHVRVLIGLAEQHRAGKISEDDVYVWWAKVRSPNRQRPLPHAADVLALDEQIRQGEETYLYLSDYRSLYVALLGEVTADDVPGANQDERRHMPEYYASMQVDFWFRVFDIRRIVGNDLDETIAELKKLRNVRYGNRPVSMYGGMVDLPLIVTQDEHTVWFEARDELADGLLWVQHDARQRSETEQIAGELRDNLLGEAVWHTLAPTSRAFLSVAEAIYRARRRDPGFDFSTAMVEYTKALEVELNDLLFRALRGTLGSKPIADRTVNLDGHSTDLAKRVPHQSLGAIRVLLSTNTVVESGLRIAAPHDANWLLGELPHVLGPLVDLRNPAAHSQQISLSQAGEVREQLLGIGCEGLMTQIARVKLRCFG